MQLPKIPWQSIIVVVFIVGISVFAQLADDKKWPAISDTFHHSFMPDEINLYADYIQRRASLSTRDPEPTKSKHNQITYLRALPPQELTKLILLDHTYRDYITQEGSLFIDPWTLSVWKESREQVQVELDRLWKSQLALHQHTPRFSALLSHGLINQIDLQFVIVILAITIGLILLQQLLRPSQMFSALFFFLCLESFLFLIISPANQATLFGSVGLLLCSWFLCISFLFRNDRHNRFKTNKTLKLCLSFLTLLVAVYVGIGSFEGVNTLWLHLSIATFASILTTLFVQLNLRIEALEESSSKLPPQNNQTREYRAELAKALDFISRFEFASAKQTLNVLAKKYPSSLSILEQRYHLAKLQPEHSNYPELAQKLIDLSAQRNDYRRMTILFSDIRQNSKTKKEAASVLKPEHYHKMMMIFSDNNDLDKTEQAFHFLELGASISLKSDACMMLIEKFKSAQNVHKQRQYEMLLQRIQ